MGCDKCARCCEEFTFEIESSNRPWVSELKTFIEFTRSDVMSLSYEINGKIALKFKAPCKFLQNKRCTIYKDRPEICRNFLCRKAKQVKEDKK